MYNSIYYSGYYSGCPWFKSEWMQIFYEARATVQGSSEPSSLWGSELGTSSVKHQDSNWVESNRQLQLETVFAWTKNSTAL